MLNVCEVKDSQNFLKGSLFRSSLQKFLHIQSYISLAVTCLNIGTDTKGLHISRANHDLLGENMSLYQLTHTQIIAKYVYTML